VGVLKLVFRRVPWQTSLLLLLLLLLYILLHLMLVYAGEMLDDQLTCLLRICRNQGMADVYLLRPCTVSGKEVQQ
jgi:hypothetical protein